MQNYYHANQPYDYHNNGHYNNEQIMIVADCPPV